MAGPIIPPSISRHAPPSYLAITAAAVRLRAGSRRSASRIAAGGGKRSQSTLAAETEHRLGRRRQQQQQQQQRGNLSTSACRLYEVEPAAQRQSPVPPAPLASSPSGSRQDSSSSSAQRSPPPPSLPRPSLSSAEEQLPANLRMRNLLRDCAQLFAPSSPLASREWRQRLDTASERLAGAAQHLATSRPIRIGIVGDSASDVEQLIPTLLDEPMFDGTAQTHQGNDVPSLLSQSEGPSNFRRLIRYADYVEQTDEHSHIAHSFLRELNVEFLQLTGPLDHDYSRAANDLYACDAIFFVTDDATLAAHARYEQRLEVDPTLRLVRQFANKPRTQVVVNHTGSQLTGAATLESGLASAIGEEALSALKLNKASSSPIVHASFTLAKRANEALRQALRDAGPMAPPASAWDHFSTLYESSSFGEVRRSLLAAAEQPTSPSEPNATAVVDIALLTSSFVLRRALEQALFLTWQDVEHAQQARGAAEVLSADTIAERERLHAAILASDANEGDNVSVSSANLHKRAGDRSHTVDGASKDAWSLVERMFSSRLPWWKVLWKSDDVRAETENAVEGAFGKDLEQRLMLETGKLLGVAMRLQQRTRSLFRDLDDRHAPAPSTTADNAQETESRNPFASPLLLNELRKYSLNGVDAQLRADLLTRPILQRREQLLVRGGPVDVLCQRAQQAVLSSVGITGTAAFLSTTCGVAGSSVGSGLGLPATLSIVALEPSTAGASFALATVFSAWLLQSRWTKAKRRFWRDWERIADGLDDDLKRNLDAVFDNIVAAQSIRATQGLRTLVAGYLLELDGAQRISASILEQLPRGVPASSGSGPHRQGQHQRTHS